MPIKPINGFSLVEVVIAIGVFAVSAVVIVALLPIGLNINRESHDETFAVSALSEIFADRLATPLSSVSRTYSLPALTGSNLTQTLYLNDHYAPADKASALYKVETTLIAPAQNSLAPWLMYCRVSWPAPATVPTGHLEMMKAISQVTPIP
jgi:hypothetical protein